MKERRLFLFLTFLPVALAIFFWDLDTRLTSTTSEVKATQAVDERRLPNTILENTRLTQYDISGRQSQKVASEKLLSNDFQKLINIEKPIITLETDQGHWLAESQTGTFNQLENKLSLYGEVTLTQTPESVTSEGTDNQTMRTTQGELSEKSDNEPRYIGLSRLQSPVQMQTEQLDYYPENRLAETSTQVTITTLGHRIESEGIRVDLANSVYTLPKRVRSTHEPM